MNNNFNYTTIDITPAKFQRQLKRSKWLSRFMLLFLLAQIAMLMRFPVFYKTLSAFNYWFSLSVLALLAVFSTYLYVQSLRFLKVYSRCVGLITQFETQENLRLHAQLKADGAQLDRVSS